MPPKDDNHQDPVVAPYGCRLCPLPLALANLASDAVLLAQSAVVAMDKLACCYPCPNPDPREDPVEDGADADSGSRGIHPAVHSERPEPGKHEE